MTRENFAAKFTSHEAAAEYADLNGWTLETTEPMERGVWANFTSPRDFAAEIVAEHDALTKPAATEHATIYSFHRGEDHAILATGNPTNLQDVAARVAKALAGQNDPTRRVYIHNGRGIVGAGLCRQGIWHDTLRENYMRFDAAARTRREAEGLPNDPQPKQGGRS